MKAKTAKREFQSQHVEIGSMKQDNPMWTTANDGETWAPRFIDAAVNLRESAIVTLKAKGVIDKGQYQAAEKFCRLFEAMGGSGARAIDYCREFVDGGRFPEPIGDRQIDAGKKLAAAHEALTKVHGLYAWKVCIYVCGEGRSIHELTDTRRQRDTLTDMLRLYLDCLAEHWQLATGNVTTAKRSVQGLTSRA